MRETLVSASVYEWRGLHRPGGVSVSCGPPGPSVRGQDYSTSYLKFLHSSPFQVGICSAPCLNRGKCIQKDSCQCRPGFYGATCEFSKARMRHEPQLWSWKCEIETWIDKWMCWREVHVASSSSAWYLVSMEENVGEWTGAGVPPDTRVTIVRCQPIMGRLVTSGAGEMMTWGSLCTITRAPGTSAGRWRGAGNRNVTRSAKSTGLRWGCVKRPTVAHWCSVTSPSVINMGGEDNGYWKDTGIIQVEICFDITNQLIQLVGVEDSWDQFRHSLKQALD